MNEVYKVQFSVIAPSELNSRLLSRYNLHQVSCKFYTQGVNDIYIVTCKEGTYYLKISLAGLRNKEEIEAEIAIVNRLVETGVSVASPVADMEGVFIHEVQAPEGKRYTVLWNEAKGDIKGIKTKDESINLGILMGNMHICLDGLNVHRHNLNAFHLVDKPLKYIKEFYGETPYYIRLEQAGSVIRSHLDNMMTTDTGIYGLCHGDTHNYNIRYNNTKPILFDFDCSGYGLRAYDLAVQRWNIAMFQMDMDKEAKQWSDLLEGYTAIRNVNQRELDGINILVAARNLWLMGLQLDCIHYNRGHDWLDENYIKNNTEFIEQWINKF